MPAAADRLFFARRPPASCPPLQNRLFSARRPPAPCPPLQNRLFSARASACAVMSFSAADRDIVCGRVQRVLRKVSSFCPLWSVG